jgi:hypothetical protein
MIAKSDHPNVPKSAIKNAGFFAYYQHFQTDHRAIFCDIDNDILFGKIKPDFTRQS